MTTAATDNLLTAAELATRLKVRPRTVQAWSREGRFPAVRLGPKVIRFDWNAIVAALSKPKEGDDNE